MQSNYSGNCLNCYNVESLNLFESELQLINTKLMIKNKLKELLKELNKFMVQTILVFKHKKRSDCKIFHSCTKLIAGDSDNDIAFKPMHQSIMTKIKKYTCEDCIFLDII